MMGEGWKATNIDTIDGSEIRESPVEVGNPILYKVFAPSQVVCRNSSINSIHGEHTHQNQKKVVKLSGDHDIISCLPAFAI